MDFEPFLRPVGFALDVMNDFRIPVVLIDDHDVVPAQPDATRAIEELERSAQNGHENRERIVRQVRCFGFVPLPVVNYSLLWRRYRPSSYRQAILRTTEIASNLARRFFRAFLYVMSVFLWLRFIFSSIASCGSMITFLKSFSSDILTFASRNYPFLLSRHCELVSAIKSGDSKGVEMETIEQYLFDLVALKIQASCNNVNGTVLCELDSDSLIFKLSGILEHSYPIWDYLPLSCFTSATIVFYILYALGAQILYINIFALASFISWKRQLPLAKIFIEIVKILWDGPATIL